MDPILLNWYETSSSGYESSDSYGSAPQYKRGQEGYSGGYNNYQGGGYGEQGGKAKSKSKAAITGQNKAATKLKRYKSEQSSYEIEIASFSWRSNHDKERARNLHIRIWRLRHNTLKKDAEMQLEIGMLDPRALAMAGDPRVLAINGYNNIKVTASISLSQLLIRPTFLSSLHLS